MKIIITITEDDFILRWTGDETQEEIADLLTVIVGDFYAGVNQISAAEFESIGETLH